MSGLLTTDRAGRITSFNPEAERITGRSAASALGRDVEAVLPGIRQLALSDDLAPSHARVRTAYTSERGERLHLGARRLSAEGRRGGSRGPRGDLPGRDATWSRWSASCAAPSAWRRSAQLSASIAHEIRNPLAAISGSIQVLGRRTPALADDPEAGRLMEIVLRETDRLNALITDFLQLRAAGAAPGERDRAGGCGGRAAAHVRIRAARRGERVERVWSPASGCTRTRSSCTRCSGTCVLNAAQAMEKGGRLEIRATRAEGPSQEASCRTPKRGTGPAGLGRDRRRGRGHWHPDGRSGSHLRSFLHHQARRLGSRSGDRPPDRRAARGQRPRGEHARDGDDLPRATSARRGRHMTAKARILVVDDERSMQEFLEIFFRREGYHVVTAGDLETARTHLEEDEFDVVITDIQMPGGSRARSAARGARGLAGIHRDHDHRLREHRDGDRRDEGRRLRLHHQALQGRRDQARRREGAREEAAREREPPAAQRAEAPRSRSQHHRQRPRDAARLRADRAGGRQQGQRPDQRRERDRQGDGGARDPCGRRAPRAAVRGGELRARSPRRCWNRSCSAT